MMLQVSPNLWSCMPTAFAMAFGQTVSTVIKCLKHDGSEILWPKNPEPYNRRGFHVQEFVDLGVCNNFAVLVIESKCMLHSMNENDARQVYSLLTTNDYLKRYNGVLLGIINGSYHAAYLHDRKVYDPNGTIYDFDPLDWTIHIFCPVIKLEAGIKS